MAGFWVDDFWKAAFWANNFWVGLSTAQKHTLTFKSSSRNMKFSATQGRATT